MYEKEREAYSLYTKGSTRSLGAWDKSAAKNICVCTKSRKWRQSASNLNSACL
jgi:hypothetical protein